MKKINVAIILIGVKDISGGGGAERFWSDIVRLNESNQINYKFLIDRETYNSLKLVNRLSEDKTKIILISNNPKNRLQLYLYWIEIYIKLIINRIKIIHVGFYSANYYKILKFLSIFSRLKISITIVSCFTAYCFIDSKYESSYKMKYRFKDVFNNIKLSGVLCWYNKFKEVAIEQKIIKSNPYIYPVKHCFTDLTNYKPKKEKLNEIIFASRLESIKRPELFLELIKVLINRYDKEVISRWNFIIYGNGSLKNRLISFAKKNKLSKYVEFRESFDLSNVFPSSKIFVSTQELENFTSLSMLEAMSCGNAIIAFDVGQTDYFVKHSVNGYLSIDKNMNAMAEDLYDLMTMKDEKLIQMQNASINIVKNVHTKNNFILELDQYFIDIIS